MTKRHDGSQNNYCSACGGNGKIDKKPCLDCKGVRIEAFIDNNDALLFFDKKDPCLNDRGVKKGSILLILPDTFRSEYYIDYWIAEAEATSRQKIDREITNGKIVVRTLGDVKKAQSAMENCKKYYITDMGLSAKAPRKDSRLPRVIKGHRRLRLVSPE